MKNETVLQIKNGIEICVKGLVNNPSEVTINYRAGEKHGYIIKCAKRDVGMVIGKNGANIQSIRQIFRSMASKNHIMVDIEVEEG